MASGGPLAIRFISDRIIIKGMEWVVFQGENTMKKLFLTLVVVGMLTQTAQTSALIETEYMTPIVKHPGAWALGIAIVLWGVTSSHLDQRHREHSEKAIRLAMDELCIVSIPHSKWDDNYNAFWQAVEKHHKTLQNDTLDTILRHIKLGAIFGTVGTVIGAPLYAALKSDNGLIRAAGLLELAAILGGVTLNIALNSH